MTIARGSTSPPPPAAEQHGVFTAAQARRHGYTARQVQRRVNSGQWYAVAGRGFTGRPPPQSRGSDAWPAATLAWAAHLTWPDSVIGYRIAGVLLGWPVDPGPDVHVLLPARRRPALRLVPHQVPFTPSDVARLPGDLPITTPTRTAVDLLATIPLDDAWSLFAWLVSRRRLDRTLLTEHLNQRFGRPGTTQLRQLHHHTNTGAASPPERRLHQLLPLAGVIRWRAGVCLTDAEGIIGVVDVLIDEARIVIEVDGFAAHSTAEAFRADRRRQNRLVNAGYLVLRFTWWDIVCDPDRVVREIRRAVEQRAA